MIDSFFLNNMYWQTCQQIISFFYHIYYNLVGEFCDCFNQFQILENTLYLTALIKKFMYCLIIKQKHITCILEIMKQQQTSKIPYLSEIVENISVWTIVYL